MRIVEGLAPLNSTDLKQRVAEIRAVDVAGYSRLMAANGCATVTARARHDG
jgi:hypothetical protein